MSEELSHAESCFPDHVQEQIQKIRKALPGFKVEKSLSYSWVVKLGADSEAIIRYGGEEMGWSTEFNDEEIDRILREYKHIEKTVNRVDKKEQNRLDKQRRDRRIANTEKFAQILESKLVKLFSPDIAHVAASEIARRKFLDDWSPLDSVSKAVKHVECNKGHASVIYEAEKEFLNS